MKKSNWNKVNLTKPLLPFSKFSNNERKILFNKKMEAWANSQPIAYPPDPTTKVKKVNSFPPVPNNKNFRRSTRKNNRKSRKTRKNNSRK